MNGLFLTCLLVSASAAGGHWTLSERLETLTQRIATAGIDAGWTFTGSHPFGSGKRQLSVSSQGTFTVDGYALETLPCSAFIHSIFVLRSILHTSPIRGPSH